MKNTIITGCLLLNKIVHAQVLKGWVADNGNGTYNNAVINGDYSDPYAICVEDDDYIWLL